MKQKRETYPKFKTDLIDQYKDMLDKASVFYLLNYKGINAADISEFRKELKNTGSSFKVIQNRLAKIALKNSPLEHVADKLTGDSALIVGNDDIVAPAKLLIKKMADNEKLKLIGGVILSNKEKWLNSAEVTELSKLGSKEELLSKLLYCLKYPIENLARTLNELPTQLVRVLDAVAKKAA